MAKRAEAAEAAPEVEPEERAPESAPAIDPAVQQAQESAYSELLDSLAEDVDIKDEDDGEPTPEPTPEPEGSPTPERAATTERAEVDTPTELTPEDELKAVRAEMLELRREREQEKQGLQRQLWELREARRQRSRSDPADPSVETPAEAGVRKLLEQQWNDDGTVGVPEDAVESVAERVARRILAEQGSARPPGAPQVSDEQRYQAERYGKKRAELIAENPANEGLLGEFEKAYQWLDQEVGHYMRESGWQGSADRDYFQHTLEQAGIAARFRSLYPQAGGDDLMEFIDVGLSTDTERMAEYVRARAGYAAPESAAIPDGRRPVAPHPSHTRRGVGGKPMEIDSQRKRLAQLLEMDELGMTTAEWKELEKLELYFDGLPADAGERRIGFQNVGKGVTPAADWDD